MKYQIQYLRIIVSSVCYILLYLFSNTVIADDKIVLGAAVSLSGKYSTAGNHTKKGYDIAVDKINATGGVQVVGKSYKLEIIYYDDESTPARAAELAERLIKRDGVKFMLGPYSSGLTKAIAPITEKYKIPMVEANGASLSLFNNGYQYLFAVLSTAEQYLQEAVKLAAQQAIAAGKSINSMKVAIATENDPFSQDIRKGILSDAKKHGMKIVVDDKLPRDLSDMSATLTKVKVMRPDLMVVSGHSKGAALVTKQMAEKKVDVPMLAVTHCESAKISDKQQFKNYAEYTLCASQWAASLKYRDEVFESAQAYSNLFEKEYGYKPPYQAAESSAAILVFADAINRAQSLDTKKVRDALAQTDLKTFYGHVKFDESGKNIAKPMVLRQIQNGEYKVVAPTEWASAKLIHPRPKWQDRQ